MFKSMLFAASLAIPVAAGAATTDPRQATIDRNFAAMDTNHDGKIDKAEYAAFQTARFDRQAQSVDGAFNELDTNKDGKISKAEAAAVPAIATYFDALDINKDGSLSREEMQKAIVAAQTAEAADTPAAK
ncbi:EF-hand domain-containing protein [Bacillus sp. NP157]|nr:EF-hand domain-containing protein [Bacillus sp. NP157]